MSALHAGMTLPGDEVHVWCASLEAPAWQLRQLWQTLSADERSRALKFHFERDKKRFIAGRGLLRTILGCYVGMDPRHLQFNYGSNGKPTLKQPFSDNPLQFNLSHSQAIALLAVTRGRDIGIDVEYVRPVPSGEQIAKRFFSAQESAALRALPSSERLEAFFRCWTGKEAYAKACGVGIALPLEQIEVSLAPGAEAKLVCVEGRPQEASRWTLQRLVPDRGYIGTLAVEGHGWQLVCRHWPVQVNTVSPGSWAFA